MCISYQSQSAGARQVGKRLASHAFRTDLVFNGVDLDLEVRIHLIEGEAADMKEQPPSDKADPTAG